MLRLTRDSVMKSVSKHGKIILLNSGSEFYYSTYDLYFFVGNNLITLLGKT
jgi:hypothetical protein